jgi:hypothetical protein
MDQPYSFLADWLSKFHMASEPIQALWIVALSATVLGVTWIVMRGVREVAAGRPGRANDGGELHYGVYQDAQARWVDSHGRIAAEVDWTDRPGEFIGRETGTVPRVVRKG